MLNTEDWGRKELLWKKFSSLLTWNKNRKRNVLIKFGWCGQFSPSKTNYTWNSSSSRNSQLGILWFGSLALMLSSLLSLSTGSDPLSHNNRCFSSCNASIYDRFSFSIIPTHQIREAFASGFLFPHCIKLTTFGREKHVFHSRHNNS